MHPHKYAPHQSASVEAPVEPADPADGQVRKLAEKRRRHVQVVADAASATVRHSSLDRLAVDWGRPSVKRLLVGIQDTPKDLQLIVIALPQIGFAFGFAPAPGKLSNRPSDTATMASASVLKMPQAPRPVSKNVPARKCASACSHTNHIHLCSPWPTPCASAPAAAATREMMAVRKNMIVR
jgi:hypothetical protein